MTETLRPCPFCGGGDIRIDAHPHAGRGQHRGETIFSMGCYDCGATFPNRYSREALVECWNRRAPSPPVGELREAVEHLRECVKLVPAPGAIERAEAFLSALQPQAQGGE